MKEILQKVDWYMSNMWWKLVDEWDTEMYRLQDIYNDPSKDEFLKSEASQKFYILKSRVDDMLSRKGAEHPVDRKKWLKTLTMKDLETALGFPYQTIYNKIVPLLRKEGYEIVKERKYYYY